MRAMALCAIAILAAAPPPTADAKRLEKAQAGVRWQMASRVQADIDCDSKPDHVYLGRRDGKVYVALLRAAGAAEVLSFGIAAGDQASLCSEPAKIAFEEPTGGNDPDVPEEVAALGEYPRCKGIELSGGDCDNFHLFWNIKTSRLAWWRR